MYVPPDYYRDLNEANRDQLRLSAILLRNQVRHERRARNIMATLALVGWALALAALGGAV